MKMPDNQGCGANANVYQYSSTNANTSRPLTTSSQGAQLRSVVEAQHPILRSPQPNRAHTPLHPANPNPPSLSAISQPTMLFGGATPWQSPASSTMSGRVSINGHNNDPHQRGINNSIYAANEGNGGGNRNASRSSYPVITRSSTASNRGTGGHSNTYANGGYHPDVGRSNWAPLSAPAPAMFVSGPAIATTGPTAPSNNTGRLVSTSSNDSDGRARLENVKVIGLGGSRWATPEAAAKAVPKSIEDFYDAQAKAEAAHNRMINESALCRTGTAAPKVPGDNQSLGSASARAIVPTALRNNQNPDLASTRAAARPPSHQQLHALMRNANPRPSTANTFTRTHPRVETSTNMRSNSPLSSANFPTSLSPAKQQARLFLEKTSPQQAVASTSSQPQSFQDFRASFVRSTTPQSPTISMKNQRAPTKEQLDVAFHSAVPQRRARMSDQGSDVFATRASTPPYLKRYLGSNDPPRKSSTASSIASSQGNRPDTTDVVARRMLGRALGVVMPKKEDARSMAIDSALKQNAEGGKTSWKEIKNSLEKGEGIKDNMAEVEEAVSRIAVANKKENLKEGAEKQPIEDWGAHLGAWKAGQMNSKEKIKEEKPSTTVAEENEREKEITASKAAEAKKRMGDFYALMKSRGKK